MKRLLTPVSIIVLLFLTTSSNCKKDKQPSSDNPYGLPNATQTGENIFACRMNGQNWISEKGIYVMNAGFRNDTLFASGTTGDNNYFERIVVEINGNSVEGYTYNVSNQTCEFRLSTNKTCLGYLGSNVLNVYAVSGTVTLTKKDTSAKILSGNFTCIIPIPNCDTLKITDGRFDIRYY